MKDDDDAAQEECWDLPSDFNLYAKHEVKRVYYPSKKACNKEDDNDDGIDNDNAGTNGHTNTTSSFFLIECIEPDSPLDINNTTQSDSTQYDATGHCVWAGAFLLIQCIHELLEKKYYIKQLFNNNNNNIGKNKNNKRMIEFGCGTGIGGLAFFMMMHKRDDDNDDKDDTYSNSNSNNNSNSENNVVPSSVYFTDNDPDALRVCERNCKLNNLSESSYTIGELTWGEEDADADADADAEYATTTDQFDIALATDVLYDVDLIHPLFTSVSKCLVRPSSSSSSSDGSEEGGGGIFILSHIPRACYNEGNPPEAVEDLEKYIIDEAVKYGLHLVDIVRPPKKKKEDGDASFRRAEISDWTPVANSFVGGGILIFRRA